MRGKSGGDDEGGFVDRLCYKGVDWLLKVEWALPKEVSRSV